jgi:hypothetical protein
MADQKKDTLMDEMLDSLLAKYSSEEPRPGLESRILANLSESARKEAVQGWWNLKWFWAGAVATGIIIAVLVINGRQHVAPPTNVVVKAGQPVLQPEIRPHFAIKGEETGKIHRHRPLAPTLQPKNATLALSQRPAIFPTPTPLSEQEKLLLRYLAGTPREEVIAQSRPEEPMTADQDQTEAIPDLAHFQQKISNTR